MTRAQASVKSTFELQKLAVAPPASPASCKRLCDHYRLEARRIQASLLPTASLQDHTIDITFRFIPFSDVSGDLADFFYLPDGRIGLYLGDVVGKGLPAAMYGALVMGTLRGIHKTGVQPAQVLTRLNERLTQRPLSGRFCCMLYALFDPATCKLSIANAGLPLPLFISGKSSQTLGSGGIPPGLFPAACYEQYTVQLSPGDCVLFATDGVHETHDLQGTEIDSSQMAEIWETSRRPSADRSMQCFFRGLKTFSQGSASHDDETAIILQVPIATAS